MKDLEALGLGRPGIFAHFSNEWQPPSASEVRALLKLCSLTGSEAGRIVGVKSGTVRKWAGGDVSMPYAAWHLLAMYAGLAAPLIGLSTVAG